MHTRTHSQYVRRSEESGDTLVYGYDTLPVIVLSKDAAAVMVKVHGSSPVTDEL